MYYNAGFTYIIESCQKKINRKKQDHGLFVTDNAEFIIFFGEKQIEISKNVYYYKSERRGYAKAYNRDVYLNYSQTLFDFIREELL